MVSRLWTVLAALAIGLGSGCTGGYEARLASRAEELAKENRYNEIGTPAPVGGTNLQISIPKDMIPLPSGTDPVRLKLPVALPGWLSTYEGVIGGKKEGWRYHLFLATTPKEQDPTPQLHAELAKRFPNTEEVGPVNVQPPVGAEVVWQRFRARGKQSFYFSDDTGARTVDNVGVIEVWSRTDPAAGATVLVIWRIVTDDQGVDAVGLGKRVEMASTLRAKR